MGAAAALSILGAACAKSATPTAGGTTQPTATNTGGYGGGYGGGGTTPTPSQSPGGVTFQALPGSQLRQGAGGFNFTPSDFTVTQGAAIMVTNVGSTQHTFTVTGQTIDLTNNPGQTQSVSIDLPPGTYQYFCRFHVSLGMKGTFQVTG